MSKNILFICTSNKDRSKHLENYFTEKHPYNQYKSAGINRYFTEKYKTNYISIESIKWSDFIVFAAQIHFEKTKDFADRNSVELAPYLILNQEHFKYDIEDELNEYLKITEMKLCNLKLFR